ncbi:MAG: hypothetical protein JWR70_1212 [Modestobacter sp.]|nr:hypothetical protein [Modestobacter sp.]
MLGRKDYPQDEVDRGRSAIERQLAAYDDLATAVRDTAGAEKAQSALAEFETRLFAALVLALDRPFVHRLRGVTGKDSNPLNEVELICDSLMNNDGVMRGTNVIRYVPEQSVVGIAVGEQIQLTAADFTRLSTAFFAELERRFVQS